MVILDFNGPGSGVGRCTVQVLRELETDSEPALLTGTHEHVHRFPVQFPDLKKTHFYSLDRPRYGLRHLHIRHLRNTVRDEGRYSSRLIDLTRKRAANFFPQEHRGLLINYPQFTPPPSNGHEFAVFVHDLNWRHFPGNFSNPDGIDQRCRRWVEGANRVVANSEFTRRELIEHYGCHPGKVIAAPLAPFHEPLANGAATDQSILVRLGLRSGEYFLYPNGWGLHKGFDILTDALEQTGDILPVVITCGEPDGRAPGIKQFYASLQERWSRLIAQKKLVVSGWLGEADIHALRTHCHAFVLPNLFEGFGFPLVEAIYCHRPAIASEIPSHREILDRYPQYRLARVFPSGDAAALAEELRCFKTEPAPVPAGWKESIESTWSWRHTLNRIRSAVAV